MDITRDINSLSNFKRNTPEFIRQLKETGEPVVLTINGKAELVVQDSASYQKMVEKARRVDRMEALRASIQEMQNGIGTSADNVLAELRQMRDEMKAE
jgi:prevent-host-death family protein